LGCSWSRRRSPRKLFCVRATLSSARERSSLGHR